MSRPGMRLVRSVASRFGADLQGQALVEFALVLPILLGLLIGIVELGQAWRSQQVLTHTVREAARLAILPTTTNAQVSDHISLMLGRGGLDPSKAQTTLGLRAGTGTSDTVRVQYPYAFPVLGPVVRLINPSAASVPPGSVLLSSTYVMRNE